VKSLLLFLALNTLRLGSVAATEDGAPIEVHSGGLTVKLSADGRVISAKLGENRLPRTLTAETLLAGCRIDGKTTVKTLADGVEFVKPLVHDATKNRCLLVERFLPGKESIRWEIEIRGQGGPWTTDIATRLQYPDAQNACFWTAWSDPDQHGGWQDPLVFRPFADRLWNYNGGPGEPNLVAVPLVTIVEPAGDLGLSLVLSPEDILLDQQLKTTVAGGLTWTRSKYRIGADRPLRFAMDLVTHPADWRGGLRWMVARYPQWFNPPNPRVDEMAGCAAYSADERHFDVTDLYRMAFRINWKCSEDFPYMGMFLPPLSDENETWHRHVLEPAIPGKSAFNSFKSLNDYSRWMRERGLHVLSYFNVTEFGRDLRWPAPPRKATRESDLWKDPNDYLYAKLPNALLMLHDKPVGSWEGAMGVDPGDPVYQKFLLEQAQRHLDRLPAADGICIDRMDWLRFYNPRGDDGQSWVDGRPARSLYMSWREIMSKLGPLMHRGDKVIFGNNQTKRLELLRHLDGIYCEFGHMGPALNVNAILAVRKPLLCWTPDPGTLQPDPDAYFQRHLHLGAYPTAPYPNNNHCIQPNTASDQSYLDYGPLLDAIRGKRWVLRPHVIEVLGKKAKANLFEVPGGYVLPVTFGGQASTVAVVLADLPRIAGQNGFRIEVIHPGENAWSGLAAQDDGHRLRLDVPLRRGCAMVKLAYAWIEPKTSAFVMNQTITLGTTIAGGQIHYTTDGTAPTAASPRYADPFSIDKTTSIRAAVFSGDSRLTEVFTADLTRLPMPAPRISTGSRTFGESTEVSLALPLNRPGAEIHYTLDGTAPTADSPRYAAPLRLTKTTTIQAVAIVAGQQSEMAAATFVARGPKPPRPDVYLSDLKPERATVGWGGQPRMDHSIQGGPLSITGSQYARGVGVHAVSELVYDLRPDFRRFVAVVGVDDEMKDYPQASVAFEVWLDGRPARRSIVMRPGDFYYFDVPIPAGSKRIRLVVTDGGDGIFADHADWAAAGFLRPP
jgi:hypothetical protein